MSLSEDEQEFYSVFKEQYEKIFSSMYSKINPPVEAPPKVTSISLSPVKAPSPVKPEG